MRQKGNLGWQAKAAHFISGHQRNAGKLLGARVFVDEGVGNKQGVIGQHQRVDRGKTVSAFF